MEFYKTYKALGVFPQPGKPRQQPHGNSNTILAQPGASAGWKKKEKRLAKLGRAEASATGSIRWSATGHSDRLAGGRGGRKVRRAIRRFSAATTTRARDEERLDHDRVIRLLNHFEAARPGSLTHTTHPHPHPHPHPPTPTPTTHPPPPPPTHTHTTAIRLSAPTAAAAGESVMRPTRISLWSSCQRRFARSHCGHMALRIPPPLRRASFCAHSTTSSDCGFRSTTRVLFQARRACPRPVVAAGTSTSPRSQALKALEYVHSRGSVRDLKPDNPLVDPQSCG